MARFLKDLEQQQKALDELFAHRGIVLAYLYGSQARGTAGPMSDVDMAVLFGPGVPGQERFPRLLQLMGDLGTLFHREDVNLVDLAEVSPLLGHRVYHEGRLFYCADDVERVRFEMSALRRYVDTAPLRKIKRQYVLKYFGAKT